MKKLLLALGLLVLIAAALVALAMRPPHEPPRPLALPPRVAALPTAAPAAVRATSAPEAPPAPAAVTPPAPTATPALAPGDLNVLLLGSDRLPSEESWRTDAIVVVAIRPRARLAAMFSVPRDLWVEIPGYGPERIDVADYLGERAYGPGGGPALVGATLEQNLSIPVHAYARVDFAGLVRIVDALGGVTIAADRAYPEIGVIEGRQRMDGRTALTYCRDRRHTNDLDRTRRQQQLLVAIRDAALHPAVLRQLPALARALSGTVETDLGPAQVLWLARVAHETGRASYRTRVFDTTMVRDWVTPGGAMVLLPDRVRIEAAWAELTTP